MNGYDEHLISMAGGDGDGLDQIQRRADSAAKWPVRNIADVDRETLLALVRERDAAIARVLALAASWESRGEQDIAYSKAIPDAEVSMSLLTHGSDMVENARHIRAALEPTP